MLQQRNQNASTRLTQTIENPRLRLNWGPSIELAGADFEHVRKFKSGPRSLKQNLPELRRGQIVKHVKKQTMKRTKERSAKQAR